MDVTECIGVGSMARERHRKVRKRILQPIEINRRDPVHIKWIVLAITKGGGAAAITTTVLS